MAGFTVVTSFVFFIYICQRRQVATGRPPQRHKRWQQAYMTDSTKNWGTLLLWNIAPVLIVHSVARLFWKINIGDDKTNVVLIEMLFTAFIFPIYLTLFNYISLSKKLGTTNKLGIWAVTIFSLGLSVLFGLANWADSIESWSSMDSRTLGLIQLEFIIGFAISGIGTLLSFIKI